MTHANLTENQAFNVKALIAMALILLVSILLNIGATAQTTQTFTSSGTFTVPAGVTTVQVEAWGGGGAGGGVNGSNSQTRAGGGGSGGAYVKNPTLTVTPGATINYTVGAGGLGSSAVDGANGAASTFNTVTASGGNGGKVGQSGQQFGTGGAAVTGTFNGGAGAAAAGNNSGGGGGSAGSTGNGGNASGTAGGAAGAGGGGAGANGLTSSNNGTDASNLGAGGSGGRSSSSTNRSGGDGFRGQIKVTYTCPSYSLTSAATATGPFCGASTSVVTLRSSSMPSGSYVVTYSLSGANSATNSTAAMTYNAGAGTGTFTTSSLANAGSTTVTVTNLASGGCGNSQSANNTVSISNTPAPTAVAGTAVSTCATSGAVNITTGSSSANNTGITWTSNGTGTFTNPNSLTTCTYLPSAADIAAGSRTLTLTATGNAPCINATSTKTITINQNPTSFAGTAINTCATSGAVNITAGASASNQASASWTSNGTGTFANATSLTTCTYTPSASDIAAGSRILTLTANPLSGCAAVTSTKTITIHAAPGIPGVIAGTSNVCGTLLSGLTYSIPTVSNATNYVWTIPTGWAITNGQGTNVVTITSGNNGQNGNITVAATNAGCNGTNPTTTVNIFPVVGTHNTGYTTTSTKTSGDMQCNSGSLAGYVKFPLSTIPSGSTITASVLSLVNNGSGSSSATNDIRALGNNDPISASASNLYSAATSGTSYSATTWSNSGTVNLTLNASANADIQNRITSPGYIGMGLDRGGSTTYLFHGFNAGANAPKLAVTYTSPRTLAVTVAEAADLSASSNAPVCEGVGLNFSAINNASGQSTGNTFLWSGPNGFNSVQQSPNLNNCNATHAGIYNVVITNQYLCTASTAVVVAVNPNPSVSVLTQSNITCNGFMNGAFTLNATAGTSPYLFTDGSNFNLDGIFTGIDVGSYTTSVFDANGCFSELPITITQPDVLALNATNNSPLCEGSDLNFSAGLTGGTTPYSISWTGPNGFSSSTDNNLLPAANPLATGNYVLSVVDANGCLQGTTLSLAVDQAATVSAGSDQFLCNASSVSISGNKGGSATLSMWTTSGDGVFSDASNVMSTYTPGTNDLANNTVTLTLSTDDPAGICPAAVDNLVSKLHATIPAAPVAVIAPLSVCPPVNGVSLSVTPYVAADSYVWTLGPSTTGATLVGSVNDAILSANLVPTPNNGYTFRVHASNACGTSATYASTYIRRAVSTPQFPIGATVACANDVKTYSIPTVTGADSYTWNAPVGSLINGNPAPFTAAGLTSVNVTFATGFTSGQVSVAASVACYTSIFKSINVSAATVSVGAITGATYTVCPGQSYTYSVAPVNGAYSYNWVLPANVSGSSSSNSIVVTIQPGFSSADIKVSATSICGVASVQQKKGIATGVPSRPASITGPNNGMCGQTVVNLCPSQPGITYNWTIPSSASIVNGQGTNAISVSYGTFTTGTVCVAAVNGCGTSQARCITVNGAPATPAAITAIPGSWCANTAGVEFVANIANLTGNYTLSWMYPGATVATYVLGGGNSTSLILDWKTGSGNVIVTASNSCGSGSRFFNASSSCREEGEIGSIQNNNLNVYPNPAHGNLNVSFTVFSEQNVSVKMDDISGRVIYTSTVNAQSGTNNTQLDVSKFAKGVYMLTVSTTEKNYQSRVVVE